MTTMPKINSKVKKIAVSVSVCAAVALLVFG